MCRTWVIISIPRFISHFCALDSRRSISNRDLFSGLKIHKLSHLPNALGMSDKQFKFIFYTWTHHISLEITSTVNSTKIHIIAHYRNSNIVFFYSFLTLQIQYFQCVMDFYFPFMCLLRILIRVFIFTLINTTASEFVFRMQLFHFPLISFPHGWQDKPFQMWISFYCVHTQCTKFQVMWLKRAQSITW